MLKKLQSHRKSARGFTLIELLVVIAIIAILVVIVVVAINPAERLREAADRAGASNARSAGTLLSTCITRNNGLLTACDTAVKIQSAAGGDGTLPTSISVCTVGATPNETDIGVWAPGRTSSTATWYIYKQSTGAVAAVTTIPALTTC